MHRLLPLSLSLLFASTAMSQVPYGGFEDWDDASGTPEPQGWITLNEVGSMFGAVLASEGVGAVGTSCLELTTVHMEGFGTVPSMAFAGRLTEDDVLEGFPCAQRPQALTGQLKFAPAGNDVGSIYVALTRWDALTNDRVGVAGATFFVDADTPDWTSFSIPLDYVDESIPDTMSITILSSSGEGATAGTIFSIDDLQVTGVSTGVADLLSLNSVLSLSPNPANDQVMLETRGLSRRVEVFSADGRCVSVIRPGAERTAVDISGLPPGTYMLRAWMNDGRQESARLLKQ